MNRRLVEILMDLWLEGGGRVSVAIYLSYVEST